MFLNKIYDAKTTIVGYALYIIAYSIILVARDATVKTMPLGRLLVADDAADDGHDEDWMM